MAARYKKRFKKEEVLKLLLNDASDDDSFSELDDDRESDVDFEPPDDPSDVESDDTVGSVPSEESESENGESSEKDSPDAADIEASCSMADIAAEDPLASGDGGQIYGAEQFQWVDVELNYSPQNLTYKRMPGMALPPGTLSPESSPIEFFQLFVTQEITDLMVNETNRYAGQEISKGPLKPRSRKRNWVATNEVEMKHFVGLLFTMGIVVKKKIADYWSTDPVIATPYINTVMPRNRFEILLQFWHFANNADAVKDDRLHKLRGVCDALISRFQAVCEPGRELSIDEAMVLFRGRLLFRQYLPGKRHKYGVKLYMLSKPSGYTSNFLVYCGKSDVVSGMSVTESVVMKLMESRLDLGHELYIDNYYTSVPLAKKLLERDVDVWNATKK